MAVDLIQLAAALRLGDGETAPTEPVVGIISRLLGVSQAFVAIAAPEAPEAIADEATIRMMAATLYDSPTAAAGDRYAAAWRNSGAENLVSRWVVRRAGSEGETSTRWPFDTPRRPRDASNAYTAVLVHSGRRWPTTAHGDVTVAGWRDYDFVQLFYAVGGNTYMTPPVNTVQLIAFTSLIVPIGRNVEWTLSIDAADDDVINTAQSTSGNAVAAPTATSTMSVIAWRAG